MRASRVVEVRAHVAVVMVIVIVLSTCVAAPPPSSRAHAAPQLPGLPGPSLVSSVPRPTTLRQLYGCPEFCSQWTGGACARRSCERGARCTRSSHRRGQAERERICCRRYRRHRQRKKICRRRAETEQAGRLAWILDLRAKACRQRCS